MTAALAAGCIDAKTVYTVPDPGPPPSGDDGAPPGDDGSGDALQDAAADSAQGDGR